MKPESKCEIDEEKDCVIKKITCDICNHEILRTRYPVLTDSANSELAMKDPERYANLYNEANKGTMYFSNPRKRRYVTLDALGKYPEHFDICSGCFESLNIAFFRKNIRDGKVILESHEEQYYRY